MNDFEDAIDGLATIALAVYLAVVIIRGNFKPLLDQVTKETGFVEFVIALFILSQLAKIPEVKPLVVPLTTGAILILGIKIASGANMSVFSDFAAGRVGLFGLLSGIFGSQQ